MMGLGRSQIVVTVAKSSDAFDLGVMVGGAMGKLSGANNSYLVFGWAYPLTTHH